jgi:hypothetical protein
MTAHAKEVFDPSAYPRTYALSVAGKWMVSVLGSVLVLLSLSGAIFFLPADESRNPAGAAVLFVLCGAFALLGIYLLAVAVFYRVILQADTIQVFEIYRRRYLQRGEIEGRGHFSYGQGTSAWVLVPKPGFGGKVKLSAFLKTDKDFRAWILSLPDLDLGKKRAVERERTQAIASLKQRGFSELTIQRLRRIAGGLNLVVYGLGLASFLMRDPAHVLTWAMVALPWVAILLVAVFEPYFRFGGPRNSPLPDLSLVLIIPGAFLTLHALQSIAPVGWERPLILTVFGSAILVGVAFWCDPWLKQHRGTAVLLLTVCCAYGYGAGVEINALLDQSTPQTYRVIVSAKYEDRGKSTTYHLKLAPWGPNVGGQNLMVPYSQYAAVKPGDTVCMSLRSGALRVTWSELGRCDEAVAAKEQG